jgi:dipeptidyl aminopeptidase/acylaminoacyl peptidase
MRIRSALFSACLAACFPAAQAATIPLAAFVQEPQFTNPRLSPDGKHIAITVRVPDGERFVPLLTFYSLPELKIVGQMRLPVFQLPLHYTWVSNTRVAVDKGLEIGSREAPVATGEVIATELDGTRQEYLFGYEMFKSGSRGSRYGDDYAHGTIQDLPRVLNGHIFLNAQPWQDKSKHSYLYDIDTRTGARKQLADAPENGIRFVIQPDGTPRFGYGTDDDNHALLYRYNDAKGLFDKVEMGSADLEPRRFSPDGADFVASYSASGEEPILIKQNLASGQRTSLYDQARVTLGAWQSGPNHALPFAALTETGVPRPVYFDDADENAKLHKLLSAQFPGSATHFINFSEDGKQLLFSVSSDRDPGSYYLFNKQSGKADLLFSSMPEIEPDDMAPRQAISFKARDGVELHGYLTMPKHAAGARLPFVLLPHGGPIIAFDRWYFDQDAQFLASRGYAVLQVNFRGSGGRGTRFEMAGYRQWGGKIQDDLVDAVKWATAQGELDAARGCVYGVSFGGYSALMLAAREPTLFKCAIGYAGAYDLKHKYDEDRTRRSKSSYNYWVQAIGQDDAELARFSPASQASKITIPVLLVHGGKDKRVPPVHAEIMRAALIKANNPPEWLFAPNEGHGFYDTKNITQFYQTLEAFLAKHIGK